MGASAGVSFATSSGEYYTILSCDYAMRSAACAAAGPQATVVAGVAGPGISADITQIHYRAFNTEVRTASTSNLAAVTAPAASMAFRMTVFGWSQYSAADPSAFSVPLFNSSQVLTGTVAGFSPGGSYPSPAFASCGRTCDFNSFARRSSMQVAGAVRASYLDVTDGGSQSPWVSPNNPFLAAASLADLDTVAIAMAKIMTDANPGKFANFVAFATNTSDYYMVVACQGRTSVYTPCIAAGADAE